MSLDYPLAFPYRRVEVRAGSGGQGHGGWPASRRALERLLCEHRNRAKLPPAPALGEWCCYYLCLIARRRSSERFSTLPKATQPYLESQVSPGICQTPGVGLSPRSVPGNHACPFPGQWHCQSPASRGRPGQPSKALRESRLPVSRGHGPGPVLSASRMLTRDNGPSSHLRGTRPTPAADS